MRVSEPLYPDSLPLAKEDFVLALSKSSLPQTYKEIFVFPKPIPGSKLETRYKPDKTVKKKRKKEQRDEET